jgi:cytochrome c oxidase assembly protein subunit 11
MFGFGFFLSPLYSTLCRLAGVNQLEAAGGVAAGTRPDTRRTVMMQFDSNLRDGLPWVFRPLQANAQVHPGQLMRISYEVTNNSDRAITGQAIASYAPELAAAYVHKIQCFCFSAQRLAPHEVRQMPVVFVIDQTLPGDVPTVTLSYTFFEIPGARGPSDGRST